MSDGQYLHVSPNGQIKKLASAAEALASRDEGGYIWLDYQNPSREDLTALIAPLGLHPLAIEDCLDDDQVPKIEDFTGHTFVLFNRFHYRDNTVVIEEVDFFLGPNFLVSVAAHAADSGMRSRLDEAIGIEQSSLGKGPEYLLHVILDHIVDNKLIAIEALEEEIDTAEETAFKSSAKFKPLDIMRVRRNLLALRKALFHEREILLKICRRDSPYVAESAIYHYRDIYDHLVKFAEVVEVCREMIATLMEIYLSLVNNELARLSNRTNQTVRRLTFITTIFMPLTVLAGIGGMSEWTMMTGQNNWPVAYLALIAGMGLIGGVTFSILRLTEKSWLKS